VRQINQQGLTLIEVLIAALILFMVIATSSISYQSSIQQLERAEFYDKLSGSMPYIVNQTKFELIKKKGQEGGSFQFADFDVQYKVLKKATKKMTGSNSLQFNNVSAFELALIDIELKISSEDKTRIEKVSVWVAFT